MTAVWNPWRDMNRLRHEMDQLFNQDWTSGVRAAQFPPINVWQSETGLMLTAELPGLDPEQIDVSIEKDSVTLSGQRAQQQASADDQNFVRRERWFEPFSRTMELPFDVDPNRCEASYEKGVLRVKIERAPEEQPKKLTVKAG